MGNDVSTSNKNKNEFEKDEQLHINTEIVKALGDDIDNSNVHSLLKTLNNTNNTQISHLLTEQDRLGRKVKDLYFMSAESNAIHNHENKQASLSTLSQDLDYINTQLPSLCNQLKECSDKIQEAELLIKEIRSSSFYQQQQQQLSS